MINIKMCLHFVISSVSCLSNKKLIEEKGRNNNGDDSDNNVILLESLLSK